MKLTTSFAQQQFLELLRAGLWGTPADPSHFTKEATDWKQIYRIAKEQTVQVIVADGIETLPKENWPPKEIMLKFMMVKVKTSQMHTLLNTTLCQVVNALNAEGIPSVLLKGQGVAQNYRHPESRMCGDIDLYVGKENYKRAIEAIAKLNPNGNAIGLETDMHQHVTINGVEIEVHHTADHLSVRKHRKALDKWVNECMNLTITPVSTNTWNDLGTEITLPPHTYNAFFILHHAVRHLASDGIGLRQICDWVRYLYTYGHEINTVELTEKLKTFNMEQIWEEFSHLATAALGLPADRLPLKPQRPISQKTDLLLKQIFNTGNFGVYADEKIDSKEKNIIKRKWRNFGVQSSRLFILYKISPKFTLPHSWGWFCGALGRLFRK